MDQRLEFVALASVAGANVAELCRRFGISRQTGYKWLRRARAGAALDNRSRRPHASPARTPAGVEARVLALRDAHPAWGARKLARRLADQGETAVPAASTIQAILQRHGRIDAAAAAQHRPVQRFQRSRPNELWQIDFKGHFGFAGGRCHPLSVLDDHARYALALQACLDETTATVQDRLTACFRRYGLPAEMLTDYGSPWGAGPQTPHTPLTVWLMRLGVRVLHGRPYHPQTRGKVEHFHKSLIREVLQGRWFGDLDAIARAFADWRHVYNHERPHEALQLDVPASRYRLSARAFPERLPEPEYGAGDQVRKVQHGGCICFRGRTLRIAKAFRGQRVALRPTRTDGVWHVVFMTHRIAQVDLRDAGAPQKPVNHVPEQV